MDKSINDLFYKSGNGEHISHLIFVYEIRHGPPYFRLKIDDLEFGSRIFGVNCLWSSDSRYCAFQQWLTTEYSEGPRTRLFVVDIIDKVEYSGEIAEKGFVEPVQFKDGILKYNLEFYPAIKKERILEVSEITEWDPI